MKRVTTIVIVMIFIVTGVFYFTLHKSVDTTVTIPNDHTWSEYKNTKLGFILAYPADATHPREITQPASVDGVFPGAETVVFFDMQEQQRYASVWVQQTKAKDAVGWFEEVYGPDGKGWKISTTSTIAGIPAVGVSEIVPGIAYNNYNLNFVHEGNAWSLSFDDTRLSSDDIEYIRESFRFLR